MGSSHQGTTNIIGIRLFFKGCHRHYIFNTWLSFYRISHFYKYNYRIVIIILKYTFLNWSSNNYYFNMKNYSIIQTSHKMWFCEAIESVFFLLSKLHKTYSYERFNSFSYWTDIIFWSQKCKIFWKIEIFLEVMLISWTLLKNAAMRSCLCNLTLNTVEWLSILFIIQIIVSNSECREDIRLFFSDIHLLIVKL